MTDSGTAGAPAKTRGGKRERLAAAAAQVFHHQGVERTTLNDIATAADVPLGNIYYYFKTKDQLVEAALGAHLAQLRTITNELDQLPEPADRLKALIDGWVDQRHTAARYGCPLGTLATELDKRDDGPDRTASTVMQALIDWTQDQFTQMGRTDAPELAIALVAAYQGMSVLANTLRDPEIMTAQGRRLTAWIDTLT